MSKDDIKLLKEYQNEAVVIYLIDNNRLFQLEGHITEISENFIKFKTRTEESIIGFRAISTIKRKKVF